jgi:phosphoglycolate phosphatase
VVFDWDGTLMDSITSIVECTQATLDELSLPRADDSAIRGAIGLGLREMVESFAPDCEEETFRQIVETYRRLWFGAYSSQTRLFSDVTETLDSLQGSGYLLAVATAKSRRGLDRDLRVTGLEEVFQATRTQDESRSKPHPQMILDILDALGVDPCQTLMIGDTAHDLEMAHSAGALAAAVGTGSYSREDLLRASPQAYFERVGELPQWLADGAARTSSG